MAASGTTWVLDIINYKNEYRYIFEPFHLHEVEICRGFKRQQYLRPDDRREDLLHPARIILSGQLRNHWADRFYSGAVSGRRLIKDIRVNLMLGWISANFPRMPVLFLLRHPYAVVYSRIERGWKPRMGALLSQRELVEDFLEPFEDEMRSAKTDFERHIFSWCVQNYVPLTQLGDGEFHLTFYENLCEDPEGEVKRLFAFLDKGFYASVLDTLKKPSVLSGEGRAIRSGERLVDCWRKHVTGAQLRRAVEILGLFELEKVYSEEAMPNASGAHALILTGNYGTNHE